MSSQQDVRKYDPWVDYNEDGKIDIKDIATAAIKFGTSGDPTKNVNVTNWPESMSISIPKLTTYANHSFASPNPYQEVTLLNITGPGRLRYLMMIVYCETYPNNFAGPFKIIIDGKVTMELSPDIVAAWYASKEGQISIPRLMLELYDTTNWDFKWGVELDSYFEHRLVITYRNTSGRSGDGANAFIIYEA